MSVLQWTVDLLEGDATFSAIQLQKGLLMPQLYCSPCCYWFKARGTRILLFPLAQGRLVFGNHLVERSLVVYFDKAEAHYSTTKVASLTVVGRQTDILMDRHN